MALDACTNTAPLCWAERLYFLAAAGEKHEAWRTAYAERFLDERVPQWSAVVSAVIELWGASEIDCFEMAALYTLSECPSWRRAGELWCVSCGCAEQLAQFWSHPVSYSGELVAQMAGRSNRLAS